MNILFLAPQPFYQHRGSPIAVKLVLEVLAERGDTADVLTYHEGEDVALAGITLYRTPNIHFLRHIRPGFSWKKLVCDVFLAMMAIRMCLKARYTLVHAVEEAVFIALVLKALWGIPYLYDMDSSLPEQLVEKHCGLAFLLPLLRWFEKLAVRHALAVVPVCNALQQTIEPYQPKCTVVLYDMPLPQDTATSEAATENLRERWQGHLVMYVGNLEPYQGIDLLLESFALACQQLADLQLVIIGGRDADIAEYERKACKLGIQDHVHFLGERPVTQLASYLAQADILVSPRIRGTNTPMKIYSYLESGKALLATDLWTHTQALNPQVALLTAANAQAYGAGLVRLASDAILRSALGEAGKRHVAENFSYARFHRVFNELMNTLKTETEPLTLRERTQ